MPILLEILNNRSKNLNRIYNIVKDSIIDQGLVFFGGYAIYSYGKYLPAKKRKLLLKYPDFDVLALDPLEASEKIVKNLIKPVLKILKFIKKLVLEKLYQYIMKLELVMKQLRLYINHLHVIVIIQLKLIIKMLKLHQLILCLVFI